MDHAHPAVPSLSDCFILPRPPAQILLAEDDMEMRAMVADQLRDDGHHVIETANGMQLIRAATRFEAAMIPFDLLITDIRMPGWNGLEALEHLRRAGMKLPVIVMTAFGDARLHALAEDLGAALVLDKPFDLDDLRFAVARLLQRPAPEPLSAVTS
jgi:DNA-binding response OmpR family regulator